jgi:hypothetical protein
VRSSLPDFLFLYFFISLEKSSHLWENLPVNQFHRNTLILGLIAALLMPWYRIDGNFWSFQWLTLNFLFMEDTAPLFSQLLNLEKYWLALPLIPFIFYMFDYLSSLKSQDKVRQANFLNKQLYYGLFGLGFTLLQAFLVGDFGVNFDSIF